MNELTVVNESENFLKSIRKKPYIIAVALCLFLIIIIIIITSILSSVNQRKEIDAFISYLSGKTCEEERSSSYKGVVNLKEFLWLNFKEKNSVSVDEIVCNSNKNKIYIYNPDIETENYDIDTKKKEIYIQLNGTSLNYSYSIDKKGSVKMKSDLEEIKKYNPVINRDVDIEEITKSIWDFLPSKKEYVDEFKNNFDTSNSFVDDSGVILRDKYFGNNYVGYLSYTTTSEPLFFSSYTGKYSGYKNLDFIVDPAILFLKHIPSAISDKADLMNKFLNAEKITRSGDYAVYEFKENGILYQLAFGDNPLEAKLWSIRIEITNSSLKVGNFDAIQKILNE